MDAWPDEAWMRAVAALRELFVVFDDARTVRELAPDLGAVARLEGVRGVVVTAPAADRLVGYQASARGGYVRTHVRGDRVELGGRAVTVLEGELAA